jgi:hypothetical protein
MKGRPGKVLLCVVGLWVFLFVCLVWFGLVSFWYWGLNSGPILEPFCQRVFVMCFFQIGSHELFARAGFEP